MLVNFIVVIAALGFFALVVIGFLSDDGKANTNSSDDSFFDGLDDESCSSSWQSQSSSKDKEALETWYWQGHK